MTEPELYADFDHFQAVQRERMGKFYSTAFGWQTQIFSLSIGDETQVRYFYGLCEKTAEAWSGVPVAS